jgi:hypothetical protein
MTVLDVSQGQWFILADVEVNHQHFFAATMALPMRRDGQQTTIVYIQSRATEHNPQESSHLVANYGAATLLTAEHYRAWLRACNA